MVKVAKILETIKTGEGAKGPWTLVEIETEEGKRARGFMPVTVGDEVDLSYNEKYKNYDFKKVRQSDIPAPTVGNSLAEETYKGVLEILSILRTDNQVAKKVEDRVIEDIDEPIDINDIPF